MNHRVIERQKDYMKTKITIKVVQKKEKTVAINQAIEDAFYEFERIVKQYTRFNEDSELSNVNRMAGEWVKISDEFCFLLDRMLYLAKASKGAFDPTISDFLEFYGYNKDYDFSCLDNPKLNKIVEDRLKSRPSWEEIELDLEKSRVKLVKNQKVDLGGVGKGYAVDCAIKKLTEVCTNFIIDAGGDVYAVGHNSKDEKWSVGLKTKDSNIGQIELDGQCLASSGSWARKFKQFHHLINPKTGEPIETDYSTVFVRANTGLEADGWATALFIAGKDLQNSIDEDIEVHFA